MGRDVFMRNEHLAKLSKEELMDLIKRFEGLDAQFTKTINRFQRGNKNTPSLFSQVEALKDYGISTSKEIPTELLCNTKEIL